MTVPLICDIIQMKYDPTITYMKALAIMLMVLCHCNGNALLHQIVYAFHMPLFFIVSGFCFKTIYIQKPITFVWKRIKGLWWPYVKWGFIFLAMHNVFYHLNIYNNLYGYIGHVQHLYSKQEFIDKAICLVQNMQISEQLLGGYWFVKSLFIGSLMAYAVLFICHAVARIQNCREWLPNIVGAVVLLVLCIICNQLHKTFTILFISPREFLAASFFAFGHCLAIAKVPRYKIWLIPIAFAIMIANSFYFQMEMGQPFYDSHLIIQYTISAILGTWCVYSLPWQRLTYKLAALMKYIGEHTLEILTWHFLCFKIVSLIIIGLYGLPVNRLAEFPTIGAYTNRGWFVAYFIVGVSFPLLVIYFARKVKYNILRNKESKEIRAGFTDHN